jgi:hypothetical protein
MAAKKVVAAKRVSTTGKKPAANGVTAGKKPNRDEIQAIKYYLGPDGKIVREVLDYPEPKRLSPFGKWMKAHPKGILKIMDMKAVMR